jgi:hypothetical protein
MKRAIAITTFSILIQSWPALAVPFSVDISTLYITGGNVGIATTDPSTTLDVNGPTAMRGPLTIAGSSISVKNSSMTVTYSLRASSVSTTAVGPGVFAASFSTGVAILNGGNLYLCSTCSIVFGDLSVSTSANATASNSVTASTYSFVISTGSDITGSSLSGGRCIAGTTVSFVLANAANVEMSFSCPQANASSLADVRIGFVVDGGWISPFSATRPVSRVRETGSGNTFVSPMTIQRTTTALSAGGDPGHTFCLSAWSSNSSNWQLNASVVPCVFMVRELR